MIPVPGESQRREPRCLPSAGLRKLGVLWGIGGIAAILLYAALSLGRYTLEAVEGGLTATEWLALIATSVFMAWAEGYRGFQQRFSPRVAARALHLYREPTLARLVFAPLFCTGYFGATRRLRLTIWIGTALIVGAVVLFNRIPQPWRGILDSGVLVGLCWGTVTLLASTWVAFREGRAPVAAEVSPAPGL